ncbi:phage major capsid protein [Nocardioides jensenii]|uniref:phage major capsid protein n=1 Tax=Nocardioides jensenii TaxID=1843 RepID=UPI00083792B2|nr:phage major capsid protein [Nocardioides jensenii]
MEKWKSLLKQAQAAAKAAQDIAAKGTGPDGAMTEAERTEFQGKHDEALRLKGESDQAKKDADSQALLKDLASVDGDAPDDGATGTKASGWEVSDRGDMADIRSFGEKFVKSAAYGEFRKEFPNGVGRGTPVSIGRVKVGERGTFAQTRLKTLTFGQAHTQPVRFPTIDLVDRDRLTLLDLIDHGQTDGDFEYVQVTGVTRNAKIVGELTSESLEADLKPVSDMTTQLADAKVYTYADGYDVTNKLLANAPAFATYMNNELKYSLDNLIEDKLLNGTGTNGEPLGILSTTGVQQVEYTAEAVGSDGMPTEATAKAFIRAIRMAILQITRLPGGTVTGIVMSPEMDAAMDLLQDLEGRYFSGGPFSSGPATLWGRPRVTSERVVDTNAILGDWKQVALLDNEGLSVLVFNQHKDYAQRNLNYVRGELSAAQAIWKPNRLTVVKPAVTP